jgi:hypothetical protein
LVSGTSKSMAEVSGTPAIANESIIDERHFVRMLRVERKRTERSGKPFMLMLVDGGDLFDGSDVLNDLVAAIGVSTRETDSLGWYETGSILGVLFTELGTAELAVIETIVELVARATRCRTCQPTQCDLPPVP